MRRKSLHPGILVLFAAVLWAAPAACAALEPRAERIVFVGDSITDGHTYPLLLRQSVAEAGLAPPVCINAGVGGDTARQMRKRVRRDVLVHRPTLVALSVGVNDAHQHVKSGDYEADVAAIGDELMSHHIPLLILTTTVLGPDHAATERSLVEYNAILHRLAARYHARVAEVYAAMQKARAGGQNLLEADQIHLNFAGYQVMVRAVLDAMDYTRVAVPRSLKATLMPGIIQAWQVRAVEAGTPALEAASVRALAPTLRWTSYTIPEREPLSQWWPEQERQRGFAMSLDKRIGPGSSYQGIASIHADKERQVFFNTGAQLQTIWLNGTRIYKSEGWTGWHAGKERIPARLKQGANVVVIETGAAFFLSVTDDNSW